MGRRCPGLLWLLQIPQFWEEIGIYFSLLQHFVLCNQHLFISFTLWRQQKGLKVSQNKPRLERTHGIWAWLMWAKGTTLNGSTRRGNDIEVSLEEQKFLISREIGQAKNSWFFGTNSQLPQCWGLPLNLSQCTGLAWSPGNSWFESETSDFWV